MRNSLTKSKTFRKIFGGLSKEIKHAFFIETSYKTFPTNENAFLENCATNISRRKLATPAILFLETLRPLNYIGNQTMIFFRPFASIIFPMLKYDKMSKILEKRDSINKLINLLEKKI